MSLANSFFAPSQYSLCLPLSNHPSILQSSASDLLLLSPGWQVDCVKLIEKGSLWGETVELQPSVKTVKLKPPAVTPTHQGPPHAGPHSGANVCKHSRVREQANPASGFSSPFSFLPATRSVFSLHYREWVTIWQEHHVKLCVRCVLKKNT